MSNTMALKLKKEYPGVLHWNKTINGANFDIWIPTWRVPSPWPDTIYATIQEDLVQARPWLQELERQSPVRENPKQPLIATIYRNSLHARSIRFDPSGDSNSAQIGSEYIPYEVLENRDTQVLVLRITWGAPIEQ